jgi:uncharacterized phage protein gp47/JayE
MTFARPELTELITRAQADIESRLPGADAGLRRSLLNVLARMHAGAVHGLYGHLDWIARQIIPDTADAEHLERWASIFAIGRLAATYAAGNVTLTGSGTVPAGAVLVRADGAEYTADAETTIATTGALAVTAVLPGAAGNAAAGVKLTLLTPIAGIQSQGAAVGLAAGADAEDDDGLRARLLARIQQPPHGGAASDYTTWAYAAHPDVTRAWGYPLELGAGTVTVRVMTDDASADGIPSAAVVAAVQAAIDAARPVTAAATVVAPIAVPLNPAIALTPNTLVVQAAVAAELADLLRREAEPGGTILVSHLREAISIAVGETNHVLSSPAADVTHATGQIATLGTITWSSL